jgi:hypothetical protein
MIIKSERTLLLSCRVHSILLAGEYAYDNQQTQQGQAAMFASASWDLTY